VNDWIDISAYRASSDGVYDIQVLNLLPKANHDAIFWFVLKGELMMQALEGTGDLLSDRFGTGLFFYADSANNGTGGDFAKKSTRMQMDQATTHSALTAGCAETTGNLRAACNLVCFNLERNLLTSPTGSSVLVHHVSVALLASEDEIASTHQFLRRRRKLRQIVSESPAREQVLFLLVTETAQNTPMVNAQKDIDGSVVNMETVVILATANLVIGVFIVACMSFSVVSYILSKKRQSYKHTLY
jgi:hypothetical protein